MSDDDRAAKRYFIDAFFEAMEKLVELASRLNDDGHLQEAMLLVCCYIEGLGNWLLKDPSSPCRNFCRALERFGGEPVLSLFIPRFALESFPWKSTSQTIRTETESALSSLERDEALDIQELIGRITPTVSPEALTFLRENAWRATVAAVVYDRLRSRLVHWLASAGNVTFSESTHRGKPLPDVGFDALRVALERILNYAKGISQESGDWFGYA
jgi:hypothetical protein